MLRHEMSKPTADWEGVAVMTGRTVSGALNMASRVRVTYGLARRVKNGSYRADEEAYLTARILAGVARHKEASEHLGRSVRSVTDKYHRLKKEIKYVNDCRQQS